MSLNGKIYRKFIVTILARYTSLVYCGVTLFHTNFDRSTIKRKNFPSMWAVGTTNTVNGGIKGSSRDTSLIFLNKKVICQMKRCWLMDYLLTEFSCRKTALPQSGHEKFYKN